MALQLRRGLNSERTGETFAAGELVYTTDTKQLYVGDGTTTGGILVSNSVASSPAQLTQNLNLNGFNISGSGNITATAFVGDGSGLTNLPNTGGSGTGVVEGQEYAIDIQGSVRGDDTTIIVDSVLGRVSADFYGDGSNITNITLDQLSGVDTTGVTTDSILKYNGANWVIGTDNNSGGGLQAGDAFDVKGSVFGDDSSLLVDAVNGKITGPVLTTNLIVRPDSGENQVVLGALDQTVKVFNQRESNSDLSAFSGLLGEWQFATNGSDGFKSRALIQGYHTGFIIAASDGSYTYPADTLNAITNTGVALGGINPTARLDVRGNAIILEEIQIGSFTTTERNALTAANGMILYNETDNVFQIYENGAWVNMRSSGGGAETDPIVGAINGIVKADGAGNISAAVAGTDYVQPASLGNFTFTGSILDSDDSSAITITPAVVMSSDLTVENNMVVSNTVTANKFVATGTDTPEIEASTNLSLTAGNAVVITSSPLRMASFTTTARDALAAQNGDVIYNTTDNKFQGYENGSWVNLI
jgi:hypothetical protein